MLRLVERLSLAPDPGIPEPMQRLKERIAQELQARLEAVPGMTGVWTGNAQKPISCKFGYQGERYRLDLVFENATFGNVVKRRADGRPWQERGLGVASQAVRLLKMIKGSRSNGGFRFLKGFKQEALVLWLHHMLSAHQPGCQPSLFDQFVSVLSLFAGRRSKLSNPSDHLCYIREQVWCLGFKP